MLDLFITRLLSNSIADLHILTKKIGDIKKHYRINLIAQTIQNKTDTIALTSMTQL